MSVLVVVEPDEVFLVVVSDLLELVLLYVVGFSVSLEPFVVEPYLASVPDELEPTLTGEQVTAVPQQVAVVEHVSQFVYQSRVVSPAVE